MNFVENYQPPAPSTDKKKKKKKKQEEQQEIVEEVPQPTTTTTPSEPQESFSVADLKQARAKIGDFGNACWTNLKFSEEVQTRQYRSPEVIMGCNYTTAIDVWSCACLAFELATGDYMFDPKDTGNENSRDEDHLAQMIELLGDYPDNLKSSGKKAHLFFKKNGSLMHIKDLESWPLKEVLQSKYKFSLVDAEAFSAFLLPMLQYDPTKRATADRCLSHAFLQNIAQDFELVLPNSEDTDASDVSDDDNEGGSTKKKDEEEEEPEKKAQFLENDKMLATIAPPTFDMSNLTFSFASFELNDK